MVLCRMPTVLGQRKRVKMQWLQDPNQSNVDNVNNVRRAASRHFRKKEEISETMAQDRHTQAISDITYRSLP